VLSSGTKFSDTDNIKKLFAAFHDPGVQQFLRTDPTTKTSVLQFQTS
jgi:D-methionine transport system substrate-binding protein